MRMLIISHNCTNSNSNMGLTIKSIIKNLNNVEISQLFFRDEMPDESCCKSWFKITDKEVLKNIFFQKNIGKSLISKNENLSIGEQNHLKQSIVKNKNCLLIFRDILWSMSKWKSLNLKQWLDEQKPEIIIYFAGPSIFSYKITFWVAKYLNIPIVYFYTDDYYWDNSDCYNIFYKIQHFRIKKIMKKAIKLSPYIITVTELMNRDYKSLFFDAKIHTYYPVPTLKKYTENKKVNLFTYAGNLGLGRWKSLIDIADILQTINPSYFINVYSSCNDEEIIDKLANHKCIKWKGYVKSSEISKIISESKFALFVEDMTGKYYERVKYSFSTKICDILNSNTCLMMYGPKGIAPIEYCLNHQCAYVITDKSNLLQRLTCILNNEGMINPIIASANNLININHDAKRNGIKLIGFLQKVIDQKGDM